jgi:hypothetical protein
MHAPLDGLKPGKLKALSVIAMHGTEMEQRRRRMGWDFFDPCTHSILSAASSSFFLPSFLPSYDDVFSRMRLIAHSLGPLYASHGRPDGLQGGGSEAKKMNRVRAGGRACANARTC